MNRDLRLVAVSLFFWGIGEGLFFVFQTLYLQEWGASPLQIGAILGAVGTTMALAQIPAGYLTDRLGSRPVMIGSWILGTLAAVGMAAAPTLPSFAVSMMLYSMTSVIAPMNTYVTSVRGKYSVARSLTIVMVTFNLGAVIGPGLGGLISSQYGLRSLYWIAAVVFAISTFFNLQTGPEHKQAPESEAHVPRGGLLRNARFVGFLALLFFTFLSLYLPQPLASNYLQNQHQLSRQQIGLLGSVASLGNATVALIVGAFRPAVGIFVGQALVGLASLVLWRGDSMPWFVVGYFFLSGYRVCRAMAMAYARPIVRASQTGLAFGMIETVNTASVVIAPPIAGVIYTHNPYLLFLISGVTIAVVLSVNLGLLPQLRRLSPPADLPVAEAVISSPE